jgi:hypothetical protein
MDDVTDMKKNNMLSAGHSPNLEAFQAYHPLIYPGAKIQDPFYVAGIKILSGIRSTRDSRDNYALNSYDEFLYIFPTWPDSLSFNLREVVVNTNAELGPNTYPDLNFQDF